jgi:hypothetical protein
VTELETDRVHWLGLGLEQTLEHAVPVRASEPGSRRGMGCTGDLELARPSGARGPAIVPTLAAVPEGAVDNTADGSEPAPVSGLECGHEEGACDRLQCLLAARLDISPNSASRSLGPA